MAIEYDEPRDRETWSSVARFWYKKAADKSPKIRRLSHHLAILSRLYSLEQLSLYVRSLTCLDPFKSARGRIVTLFNRVLGGKISMQRQLSSFETRFITAHGIFFTSDPLHPDGQFDAVVEELRRDGVFDNYIHEAKTKFGQNGVHAAISNLTALFEYGVPKHGASQPILSIAFEEAGVVETESDKLALPTAAPQKADLNNPELPPSGASLIVIAQASRFAFFILSVALRWPHHKNVYPLVHVYLAFLQSLVSVRRLEAIIDKDVPWGEICSFLNCLVIGFETSPSEGAERAQSRLSPKDFPNPEQGAGGPLSEIFILRGQLYTQLQYPATWFTDPAVNDDERAMEMPWMSVTRIERLIWHGHGIASVRKTMMPRRIC